MTSMRLACCSPVPIRRMRGCTCCWCCAPPLGSCGNTLACSLCSHLHPAAPACAAASLGQVYRGVLRSTGEAVAVKVQRPGVAASIALDVFVLRQVGRNGLRKMGCLLQ